MKVLPGTAAIHGPWTHPDDPATVAEAPPVAGFAESPFVRLVSHVGGTSLDRDRPPDGSKVALVLASVAGDVATASRASRAVASGGAPSPLLFYQSVPTAVLGHLSIRYGLTGPILCLSGGLELVRDALEDAGDLLATAQVDRVLLVYVDVATDEWYKAASEQLAATLGEPVLPDVEACVAVQLESGGDEVAAVFEDLADPVFVALPRPLRDIVRVASSGRIASRTGGSR